MSPDGAGDPPSDARSSDGDEAASSQEEGDRFATTADGEPLGSDAGSEQDSGEGSFEAFALDPDDPPAVDASEPDDLNGFGSTLREAHEVRASAPAAPANPSGPARGPAAAWVRALLNELPNPSVSGAWKTLTVPIGDEAGTVTVRATREDERVVVAVGFSDATLRAQAQQQLDRLQQQLEARFDAPVDLHLSDGAGDGARGERQPTADGPAPAHASAASDDDAPTPNPLRTRAAGARREWIG